jgi:hypothetical protein
MGRFKRTGRLALTGHRDRMTRLGAMEVCVPDFEEGRCVPPVFKKNRGDGAQTGTGRRYERSGSVGKIAEG